jgi:hypothetical protein
MAWWHAAVLRANSLHPSPSGYEGAPGTFSFLKKVSGLRTQRCKHRYKFARKAWLQVRDWASQCCHGSRVVVVACMVLLDVGNFLFWSTVQYTLWEAEEEVGGGSDNRCTSSFGGGLM